MANKYSKKSIQDMLREVTLPKKVSEMSLGENKSIKRYYFLSDSGGKPTMIVISNSGGNITAKGIEDKLIKENEKIIFNHSQLRELMQVVQNNSKSGTITKDLFGDVLYQALKNSNKELVLNKEQLEHIISLVIEGFYTGKMWLSEGDIFDEPFERTYKKGVNVYDKLEMVFIKLKVIERVDKDGDITFKKTKDIKSKKIDDIAKLFEEKSGYITYNGNDYLALLNKAGKILGLK